MHRYPQRAVTVPPVSWRGGIVAASEAMRRLLDLVERVAPATMPVMLVGETGTGKEVLARAVHQASGRRGQLVAVNCTAIATGTADSELFGHVRGAFTTAHEDRRGLLQQADHGSLLLDEIGDLELPLQGKLLRVLEDGLIRPVGSSTTVTADVRVIAATNRDITRLMRDGTFREDLYHRLSGMVLTVPPLRDRREDILPLVTHVLTEAADARTITDEATEWLVKHSWPGNVRELRNVVRRALLLAGDPVQLGDVIAAGVAPVAASAFPDGWLAGRAWHEIERDVIAWALKQYGGIRPAARALQLPASTLCDRVQHWGLTTS